MNVVSPPVFSSSSWPTTSWASDDERERLVEGVVERSAQRGRVGRVGHRVGRLDEAVGLGHEPDAVEAVAVTVTLRISGPRAVSSSRNESKSAPMAASVPPVPPLLAMLSLVIVGRELYRVSAL